MRKPLTTEDVRELKENFLTALDDYLAARHVDGWYGTVNTQNKVDSTREALGQAFAAGFLIV